MTSSRRCCKVIPSLFDRDSEDDYSSDSDEEALQPKHAPLNNAFDTVPKTYSDLLGVLLPRLQPHPDRRGLPVEEQQELSQILIGELASQFGVIQHQINDPFLSPSNNKELHRRIIVKVCSIIEDLYGLYLSKASKICDDSIMNETAMRARLKARLMLQVNKSLNIPSIRRSVLQELRGTYPMSRVSSRPCPPSPSAHPPPESICEIEQIRLKHPKLKHLPPGYTEEVSVSGQHSIVNNRGLPVVRDGDTAATDESCVDGSSGDSSSSSDEERISSNLNRTLAPKSLMGRSQSAPVLGTGIQGDSRESSGDPVQSKTVEDIKVGCGPSHKSASQKVRLGEYTDEMIRRDLMSLVERNKIARGSISNEDDSSQELSPLLAATVGGLSDSRATALKQFLSSIREGEEGEEKTCKKKERGGKHDDHLPPLTNPPLFVDVSSAGNDPPLGHSAVGLSQLNLVGGPSSLESSAGGMFSSSGDILSEPGSLEPFESPPTFKALQEEDHNFTDISSSNSMPPAVNPSLSFPYSLNNSDQLKEGGGSLLLAKAALRTDGRDCLLNSESGKNIEESSSNTRLQASIPFLEPQPDTISLSVPNMDVARASGHRVSERSPLFSLRLHPFPPVYNELMGDLDEAMIEKLDSGLQEGEDIQQIYKELSQTFPKDHLEFSKDPFLQPHLHLQEEEVDMSLIHSSNTLQRRRNLRVINPALSHLGDPPWQGTATSRKEWMNFQKDEAKINNKGTSPTTPAGKKGKGWKKWWKATLSTDDYKRFIAQQGSDFLGVVHHMYDSSGSDSDDEERERQKKERLRKLHKQLQEKEGRRLAMLEQKMTYTPGLWNTNTVLMGGLGMSPQEEEEANTNLGLECHDMKQVQGKLERMWERLKVPQQDRITMAVDYSSKPSFSLNLIQVLNLWERSCDAVERRERVLKSLEEFERDASAPSRHFSKTGLGQRLSEERSRKTLHYKLDAIERQIVIMARKLRKFGSTLTYQGQDYLEKMSMDRTEMLYFLHQQLRKKILAPAINYLNKQCEGPTSLLV